MPALGGACQHSAAIPSLPRSRALDELLSRSAGILGMSRSQVRSPIPVTNVKRAPRRAIMRTPAIASRRSFLVSSAAAGAASLLPANSAVARDALTGPRSEQGDIHGDRH